MFAIHLIQHVHENVNNLTLAQRGQSLSHATIGPLAAFVYFWTICYITAFLKMLN
jgi:hypothetical protein